MTNKVKATELEYLQWFYLKADFGPADDDIRDKLNRWFMEESRKDLPEGYEPEEYG